MNRIFKGTYAALVTPLDSNAKVNYDELARLVEWLPKHGIEGFYVAGSTAETFLLTEEERMKLLETVVDANQGRAKVICHVGDISTDKAIRFAEHAEKAGADAVSAISPFYYKFSNDEVVGYYKDVMASTSLPMFVYNFPNFSGFSLSEDVLNALKECPNLAGVKFTSSDFFLMEKIITRNPELVVWNGYDEMLISGLAMGAAGGIGSTYNCMPALIHSIYEAFMSGDMTKARELQQRANRVIEVICKYGVFASVKTILGYEGFDFGPCRKPFAKMSEEGEKALRAVYEKWINV